MEKANNIIYNQNQVLRRHLSQLDTFETLSVFVDMKDFQKPDFNTEDAERLKPFEDFLEQLKKKNVECIYTPENVIKIKFRLQGQQRFSRGRTLGWYYDEPQLRKRIEQYQLLKTGVSGKSYKTKIIDTSAEIFQNSKGLLQ